MQCSYSVCLRNKEESEEAVFKYIKEWRDKKGVFTCYYDTKSLDTVIVQKMYTTSDVVHRFVVVWRHLYPPGSANKYMACYSWKAKYKKLNSS